MSYFGLLKIQFFYNKSRQIEGRTFRLRSVVDPTDVVCDFRAEFRSAVPDWSVRVDDIP